jgi:hypothetical protein
MQTKQCDIAKLNWLIRLEVSRGIISGTVIDSNHREPNPMLVSHSPGHLLNA